MLRRSHDWLALLWVLAVGVGPAAAQPVIDQFVAGAQVIAKKECALLVVNFNVRLRYASHFPQNSGDELRISLSLIDLPVTEQRIFRREGVQVVNGNLAGIRSAAVDLDQSRGPVLRIQFEHPVAFLVTQSKSFDSIAVAISQKGSPAACQSIVGDQNGGRPPAVPNRRTGVDGGPVPGSDKTRPFGKISPEDFKVVEASMDEARAAMEKGKFDDSIRLLKKVLRFPENKHSAEAQELIGVAQQKAGRLQEARAAYETYLHRYSKGEGADRVRQRLAGVVTATGGSHEPLISDVKARSAKDKKLKFATDDEVRWTQAGSISSYYIVDDSSTQLKDLSTAPNPNADPDAHRVHQNMLLNNYNLFGTFENNATISKYRFAATEEHGFEPRSETIGISTAYAETTIKDKDLLVRVGRQSRNSGGVMGRFDGALVSWQSTNFVRLNVVAGSPNWSRFDAPFMDDKYLLGGSVDFGKIFGGLETSLFAIQQNDKWLIDRQGVGAEFRYFDTTKSALATVDYDVHFQQLNALIFSGTWMLPDKSVLTTALDYRKVPYLSSWNALQGQPYLSLYDMLLAYNKDQIRQYALDRTPTFSSAMVGYSYPLSSKFQVSGDATVTNLTGTPPSGGVDGTPSEGTEYYFSGQLIGSGLINPGDMFTSGLRYAILNNSNVYELDFNSRYPITKDLRVSPRLRLSYRTGTDPDLKEKSIFPSILLDYMLVKDVEMELEGGPRWIVSDQAGTRTTTLDLQVSLGLRYDFHADGSHRCSGVIGPCNPVALAGVPSSGSLAANERGRAAFYKSEPLRSVFVVEAGMRYWRSNGKDAYNYYADPTPTLEVSRLSYEGMAANSGEMFFRVDAASGPLSNFFVKGYFGLGGIKSGNLYDEDFPPITDPYSKTKSDTAGKLRYGSIDFGYNVYTNKYVRVGAFTGYHYWSETVDASGCLQVGSNPFICGMSPLDTSIVVITEQDRWNSMRFGGAVDVNLTDRLTWSGDFAYVTTWQRAQDTHYFTFGVSPASGTGNGFQLESTLKYQITDKFNLGVGARWWHFTSNATDNFDQLLSYTTDRYGVFVQGSYLFK